MCGDEQTPKLLVGKLIGCRPQGRLECPLARPTF